MTDTVTNSLELIVDNPALIEMASTPEGYEEACKLMEEWGWKKVKETEKGRIYQNAGRARFLPYVWINPS